jgi:hypothetical protein
MAYAGDTLHFDTRITDVRRRRRHRTLNRYRDTRKEHHGTI